MSKIKVVSFHFFAIGILLFLILLSSWQVSRHDEYTRLTASVDTLLNNPPIPLRSQYLANANSIKQIIKSAKGNDSVSSPYDDRLLISVAGKFAIAEPLKVFTLGKGKNKSSGPGFRILAPILSDEKPNFILWVDLGFIREVDLSANNNLKLITDNSIKLTGLLLPQPRTNIFTPASIPEENWWSAIDVVAMSNFVFSKPSQASIYSEILKNQSIAPAYLHLLPNNQYINSGESIWQLRDNTNSLPIADLPKPRPGRHLGYAVTWGGLATFWLIFYLFIILRGFASKKEK